jgi:hypothetical protein
VFKHHLDFATKNVWQSCLSTIHNHQFVCFATKSYANRFGLKKRKGQLPSVFCFTTSLGVSRRAAAQGIQLKTPHTQFRKPPEKVLTRYRAVFFGGPLHLALGTLEPLSYSAYGTVQLRLQ